MCIRDRVVAVNLITATTNDMIEVGDDFGFDGSFDLKQ